MNSKAYHFRQMLNQFMQLMRTNLGLSLTSLFVIMNTGLFALAGEQQTSNQVRSDDVEFLWLEERFSERALTWVTSRTKETEARLLESNHDALTVLDGLDVQSHHTGIERHEALGEWMFQYLTDRGNPHGLVRRASIESFTSGDPKWHTILDFASMKDDEGRHRSFSSLRNRGQMFTCLAPDFNRCLFGIGTQGDINSEIHEIDVRTGQLVANGFNITTPFKHEIDWVDSDHVLVSTDFGEGTVTQGGYGRIVKLWKRGTPLEAAKTVLECDANTFACYPFTLWRPEGRYSFIVELDGTTSISTYFVDDNNDAKKLQFSSPSALSWRGIETVFRGSIVTTLFEDWSISDKFFPSGTVVSVPLPALISGPDADDVQVVFQPSSRQATSLLNRVQATSNGVLIPILDSVSGKLLFATASNSGWSMRTLDLPLDGAISNLVVNPLRDYAQADFESFLQPKSTYALDGGEKVHLITPAKLNPKFDELHVEQYYVDSPDGTAIPYYIVASKTMQHDRNNPVILTAYGGAGIPSLPAYLGHTRFFSARAILAQGGAYVLANVRGGGEFGPAWKNSVLKKDRLKQFEDVAAVAKDLFRRGITSPEQLGFFGASYGGLLAGVMATRHPDLFGAVHAGVPVLDIIRSIEVYPYGNSLTGDVGHPAERGMRAFLKSYSPYHVVNPDNNYPQLLLTTNTNDRQVHPANARRMAAKMIAQGHDNVYLYERSAGGHGGGTPEEIRKSSMIEAIFFLQALRKERCSHDSGAC